MRDWIPKKNAKEKNKKRRLQKELNIRNYFYTSVILWFANIMMTPFKTRGSSECIRNECIVATASPTTIGVVSVIPKPEISNTRSFGKVSKVRASLVLTMPLIPKPVNSNQKRVLIPQSSDNSEEANLLRS